MTVWRLNGFAYQYTLITYTCNFTNDMAPLSYRRDSIVRVEVGQVTIVVHYVNCPLFCGREVGWGSAVDPAVLCAVLAQSWAPLGSYPVPEYPKD